VNDDIAERRTVHTEALLIQTRSNFVLFFSSFLFRHLVDIEHARAKPIETMDPFDSMENTALFFFFFFFFSLVFFVPFAVAHLA
jgi:hypothetical protein